MRNPFARLAKRDTARPSLRERAASLKASAARVIRRKPGPAAEPHPDAALLAAADQARPFIAREDELGAEVERLDAIGDRLMEERFGPRPDPHADWEGMMAYDKKHEAVRVETGYRAAWEAMSANNAVIWALLGPFADIPAQTFEGVAAKAALMVSELWDGHEIAREMAALFYGPPAEVPAIVAEPADPVFAAIERFHAARVTLDAYCDRLENEDWDALGGADAAQDEEGRLGVAWSASATAVLATTPTTKAGHLALAAFVEAWVDDHGNTDGSPQEGSETVFAEVYPALLRAVRISAGQTISPAAQAPLIARDFIDSLDLSRAKLRDLEAIHDAAALIGGVADAVSCQPRSYTPNNEAWNAIGLFADAISEACGAVQADAVCEARKRTPGDDWEQGLRLKILAQDTIENGDKGAITAFARDLRAMA